MHTSTFDSVPNWDTVRGELEKRYTDYTVYAKATWFKVRDALRVLPRFAETPAAVNEDTIRQICQEFASKGYQPTGINSLLRTVRIVVNHCRRKGYLAGTPFVSKGEERIFMTEWQAGQKHHSIEKLRAVFQQAEKEAQPGRKGNARPGSALWNARRLWALLYLFCYTGLRLREALYARVENLDLAAGTLKIDGLLQPDGTLLRLKTLKSARTVPIAEPARLVLERWIPHVKGKFIFPTATKPDTPWQGGGVDYRPTGRLKALGKRAGVERLTPLSLRHSFITHARSFFRLTAEEVQAIVGHTTILTQRHYTHEDVPNLIAIASRIRFEAPPSNVVN